MSGREKHASPSRFSTGDLVRVKAGAVDPDFPDIPLGGWKGTVTEISEDPPLYLIRWDQQTLDAIHPVYRHRCERDGLDCEQMYLPESELEPDAGEPTEIEQPTHVETRPLSMEDQEDRIRAVFGLTSDDSLSEVDDDSLKAYLRRRLRPRRAASPSPAVAVQSRAHGRAYDRSPAAPPIQAERKVGRNDPCPCGSGRKYKKCCMTAAG